MKNNKLLKISFLLTIITSVCIYVLSLSYIARAFDLKTANGNVGMYVIFRYFSTFQFFFAIITLILSVILLSKSRRMLDEKNIKTSKVFVLLSICFTCACTFLLTTSFFGNVFDFIADAFYITFSFIIILINIVAIIFAISGFLHAFPNKEKLMAQKLQHLNDLKSKGLITEAEFEEKRSHLVDDL